MLNREAQPGDTVIAAAGGPPGDLLKLWDATGGRACHLEFGYSCMGYEIPAGLGVRLAQPEGEVFVLIGDGTYLMNPTELVTAVQEGLKITVVVAENHGYQCIRRLQMWRTGRQLRQRIPRATTATNRSRASTSRSTWPPTPRASARRTWHVATPDELARPCARPAPKRALRDRRRDRKTPLPARRRRLVGRGPRRSHRRPVTTQLRAEYEAGRKQQRFYY